MSVVLQRNETMWAVSVVSGDGYSARSRENDRRRRKNAPKSCRHGRQVRDWVGHTAANEIASAGQEKGHVRRAQFSQ